MEHFVHDTDISTEGCLRCHHEDHNDPSTCGDCHGSEGTSRSHVKHLNGGLFGRPMECTICHIVPSSWFDEGHHNATVDIIFEENTLAQTGEELPAWNGMRCKNIYCHGASLSGGLYTEPAWSGEIDETGIQCGDCHSLPPQSPHIQSANCKNPSCHISAYTETGQLNKDVHINGFVD